MISTLRERTRGISVYERYFIPRRPRMPIRKTYSCTRNGPKKDSRIRVKKYTFFERGISFQIFKVITASAYGLADEKQGRGRELMEVNFSFGMGPLLMRPQTLAIVRLKSKNMNKWHEY